MSGLAGRRMVGERALRFRYANLNRASNSPTQKALKALKAHTKVESLFRFTYFTCPIMFLNCPPKSHAQIGPPNSLLQIRSSKFAPPSSLHQTRTTQVAAPKSLLLNRWPDSLYKFATPITFHPTRTTKFAPLKPL